MRKEKFNLANANKELILKKLKIAIIIMLVIFVVSFMVLAARIIYVSFFADRDTTVVVPDNILEVQNNEDRINAIPAATVDCSKSNKTDFALSNVLCVKPAGAEIMLLSSRSTQATVVELYLGQNADNDAFNAQNMFPGDTVTKFYCLKVYHKADVTVYFNATDIVDTKSLGNILNIKVTKFNEDGSDEQVVCNNSFSNIKDNTYNTVFSVNASQETIAYYKIEVSLPTSAGNEYQGASLSAKFNWYAENPDPTPPTHTCESKCPTCNKCLDASCTESACADKCPGHTVIPPAHACESKCPTCNKCLNATCTESVCAEKCPGHTVIPPAHTCESKCPTCNKCLDATCTESACADKCTGHTVIPPVHTCESKCPTCNKCLDASCTESACADKCPGHTVIPPVHTCESKCPTCDKCLDATCTESVCAEKCPGHTVIPPAHTCESKCPTCDKCLDAACTESACADKCPGHSGIPNTHECESKCDVCDGCKDKDCTSKVCSEKCDCSPLVSKPSKGYLIWPWTIVPTVSFTSLIPLIIVYFKKKKEENGDG